MKIVLDNLLAKDDAGQPLYADAAYEKEEKREELKRKGIIPRILSRNYRNRSRTEKQMQSTKNIPPGVVAANISLDG